MDNCIFCQIVLDEHIVRNTDLWWVVNDNFPVTKDHKLFIPKRHVETFFDLSPEEYQGLFSLLTEVKEGAQAWDKAITGFNIGMNCGKSSGQTVMHCHVHLIPRRDGDVEDPRGGIRHVIPGKGNYLK